ncbi:pilus-assembly fibrillin subunit [Xenorhabdus japonica]|uniref:Pilus-assembly fibrillin subunit, chaperone n=1 Tax=Xenorhabdus japonica TaxID=53341 RepID=A0A1I5EDJ7_9GAMM|nr:pilus-assembly fibrillin subunit [Xenorhabdus japonica]SFO09688.1 Pilus-assembly fibrillin subunit, chaperone [Xenorhabdus japonica]
MYRIKNHQYIHTTLLVGWLLYGAEKGYTGEVITERFDPRIAQIISQEKSYLTQGGLSGREGQLEVYGALVSSPCSFVISLNRQNIQEKELIIDLVDCGEGELSKNPSLPINVTLTVPKLFKQTTKLYQRSDWNIHQGNPQLKISSDRLPKGNSNLRLEITYD